MEKNDGVMSSGRWNEITNHILSEKCNSWHFSHPVCKLYFWLGSQPGISTFRDVFQPSCSLGGLSCQEPLLCYSRCTRICQLVLKPFISYCMMSQLEMWRWIWHSPILRHTGSGRRLKEQVGMIWFVHQFGVLCGKSAQKSLTKGDTTHRGWAILWDLSKDRVST